MKINKMLVGFLGIGALLVFSAPLYAHAVYGGESGYGGYGHHDGDQSPVTFKFMRKAHFLLEHKSDIGLSEEQVASIKDLNLQVEKDNIRQTAETKVFMLDLRSKLEEDKIDVDGVNAMIDKASASMTAAAKSNVAAYAKLKSTLTPDQLNKVKELMKTKMEQWKNKQK